jgi:ribosomal protein S18 acetylase RimI-like enzyme
MINLRIATIKDHDFLVEIDLKDEGYTTSDEVEMMPLQKKEHREKILKFLTDPDKGAYIFEDIDANMHIGMIMYSICNRDIVYPWTIFQELDRKFFQNDGRFLEIFQLWVHPNHRRKGLATNLKLKLEEAARSHGVNLIYTHTEETNLEVIELNKKLNYQEVRRGPIWDDITRVSLIKHLN